MPKEQQGTGRYAAGARDERLRVLDELLRMRGVSPTAWDDRSLLHRITEEEWASGRVCYGDAWTYLVQATHMEDLGLPLGLKYYDGSMLVFIGVFRRPADPCGRTHVHLVRPLGAWEGEDLRQIALDSVRASGSSAYVKKLHEEQFGPLLRAGFRDARCLPWHPRAPLEDDTYPEIGIDLRGLESAVLGRGQAEIIRKHRRFARQNEGRVAFEELWGSSSLRRSRSPDQWVYTRTSRCMPRVETCPDSI